MDHNKNKLIRTLVAQALGKKRLPKNIELDHIVPKWAGGTDHPFNLQLIRKKQHQLKTAYEAAIRARIKNQ